MYLLATNKQNVLFSVPKNTRFFCYRINKVNEDELVFFSDTPIKKLYQNHIVKCHFHHRVFGFLP